MPDKTVSTTQEDIFIGFNLGCVVFGALDVLGVADPFDTLPDQFTLLNLACLVGLAITYPRKARS